METVKELENSLERVKQHNQDRLDGIRARIAIRVNSGHKYDDLNSELMSAMKTGEIGERLAEKRLQEAREREAQQLNERNERNETARAKEEESRKATALSAWVKAGGNPKEFETAWTSYLRDEVFKSSVLENIKSGKSEGGFFETL